MAEALFSYLNTSFSLLLTEEGREGEQQKSSRWRRHCKRRISCVSLEYSVFFLLPSSSSLTLKTRREQRGDERRTAKLGTTWRRQQPFGTRFHTLKSPGTRRDAPSLPPAFRYSSLASPCAVPRSLLLLLLSLHLLHFWFRVYLFLFFSLFFTVSVY